MVATFGLEPLKLRAFVEAAAAGYNEVPYHSWYHGFSVFHTTFMILRTTHVSNSLLALDSLALLMAAICHDIGHPGVNNNFGTYKR